MLSNQNCKRCPAEAPVPGFVADGTVAALFAGTDCAADFDLSLRDSAVGFCERSLGPVAPAKFGGDVRAGSCATGKRSLPVLLAASAAFWFGTGGELSLATVGSFIPNGMPGSATNTSGTPSNPVRANCHTQYRTDGAARRIRAAISHATPKTTVAHTASETSNSPACCSTAAKMV